MPQDFEFPPVTGVNRVVTLTANRAFAADLLGCLVLLAGFTLNLGSSAKDGFSVIAGPGNLTGAMAAELSSTQAAIVCVAGNDWRFIDQPDVDLAAFAAHIAATNNPHGVTKAQLGLSNADNTPDTGKPVSTAQAEALALKADLNSPEFAGTPTAPRPPDNSDDLRIATTSFVRFLLQSFMISLDSPAFTGTPTSPTPSLDSNTTRIATTAFVNALLGDKADLASPGFSGTPTAPTPASDSNTTRIATTEFVQALLASKSDLASPAFTGTPSAPTPPTDNNTTRIATTAFVRALLATLGSAAGKNTGTDSDQIPLISESGMLELIQDTVPGMRSGSVSGTGFKADTAEGLYHALFGMDDQQQVGIDRASGGIAFLRDSYKALLKTAETLTADREILFRDLAGTVAYLSDIPGPLFRTLAQGPPPGDAERSNFTITFTGYTHIGGLADSGSKEYVFYGLDGAGNPVWTASDNTGFSSQDRLWWSAGYWKISKRHTTSPSRVGVWRVAAEVSVPPEGLSFDPYTNCAGTLGLIAAAGGDSGGLVPDCIGQICQVGDVPGPYRYFFARSISPVIWSEFGTDTGGLRFISEGGGVLALNPPATTHNATVQWPVLTADASATLCVLPSYPDSTTAEAAIDVGDAWWDTTLMKARVRMI